MIEFVRRPLVVLLGLLLFTSAAFSQKVNTDEKASPEGGSISLTAPTTSVGVGLSFSIPLTVNDVTGQGVSSFQFDIIFDPNVIDPAVLNAGCSAPPGTVAGNAGFAVVCNVPTGDPVRLKVAAFGFVNPLSGSGTLMNIAFTVDPSASGGDVSPLNFEAVQFFSNAFPTPPGIPNVPTNGQVTILGVTSAGVSVSGRLLTSFGRAVSRGTVSLSDGLGNIRRIQTNTLGYFRFDDVAVGETYLLNASARGYTFQPRTLNVMDQISDVEIRAEP